VQTTLVILKLMRVSDSKQDRKRDKIPTTTIHNLIDLGSAKICFKRVFLYGQIAIDLQVVILRKIPKPKSGADW
jgi:hypothetical protein